MSVCCLTPTQQFVSYIMARTSNIQWKDDNHLLYYKEEHYHLFILCYLFSPWYSWQIAELALNNKHSFTLVQRGTLSSFHCMLLVLAMISYIMARTSNIQWKDDNVPLCNRVNESLLFNANSAICQLYHGENK
jgi:hypothetical protein